MVWIEKLIKNSKGNSNRIAEDQNPWTHPYDGVYGLVCRHQNLMKLFLDKTIYLGLSNHINYKVIGFKTKEIRIFEIDSYPLF